MSKNLKTTLVALLFLFILVGVAYLIIQYSGHQNTSNGLQQLITKNTRPNTVFKNNGETYKLDLIPASSQLNWKAAKQIGGAHSGTVDIRTGDIEFEKGIIKNGSFIIDMKTITVTDLPTVGAEQLVEHLRGEDFFVVDKYPEATLNIKQATLTADDTFLIEADLTIKGNTHTITFTAQLQNIQNQIRVTTHFSIDRTKWDIRYGSGKFFDNLGDSMIKDTIDFSVILAFENPNNKQTNNTSESIIDLNSRVEGGIIDIEQVSVNISEYIELRSRIEGEAETIEQRIQLPTETEYRSLSSRIE